MANIIGLTGNIASGKTSVAQMLLKLGVDIYIDADTVVHDLYSPGKPIYDQVVKKFGDEVLSPDGSIDRSRLGAIVFVNSDLMQQLEAIIHPVVTEEILRRLQEVPPEGVAVVDAVKLLESGLSAICTSCWLVVSNPDLQMKRLIENRGLTKEQATVRMQAQQDVEPKKSLVDQVIDNSGTFEDTRKQVEEAFLQFQKKFMLKEK